MYNNGRFYPSYSHVYQYFVLCPLDQIHHVHFNLRPLPYPPISISRKPEFDGGATPASTSSLPTSGSPLSSLTQPSLATTASSGRKAALLFKSIVRFITFLALCLLVLYERLSVQSRRNQLVLKDLNEHISRLNWLHVRIQVEPAIIIHRKKLKMMNARPDHRDLDGDSGAPHVC
ncbi:uncharacterized protein LOC127248869 [Andrographis paniculata]|uniref:uncharacterized protein LOC127248869 n=1 Tax=Andrographis paniculata TaxID=175694 RepID=UPI0021E87894|nr:uncharacterized protein LOC127248869 [Andrographis paniculata]